MKKYHAERYKDPEVKEKMRQYCAERYAKLKEDPIKFAKLREDQAASAKKRIDFMQRQRDEILLNPDRAAQLRAYSNAASKKSYRKKMRLKNQANNCPFT
jgi:hypothetical protein